MLWNFCATEGSHLFEGGVTLDRHHAGDNRALDADCVAALIEVDEDLGVVEELCENEVSTCVDLLFQIDEVLVFAILRVGMALREACYADAEVVAVFAAN